MNTSPYFRPHIALLSLLVYRFGIPLIVFTIGLFLTLEAKALNPTLLIAPLVFAPLAYLVGHRAVERPFRNLGWSALALTLAAFSSSLGFYTLSDAPKTSSLLERALFWHDFQDRLEKLCTPETSSCLLVLFLFLFCLSSTIKSYIARPQTRALTLEARRFFSQREVLIVASVIALASVMVVQEASQMKADLARSGWNALPEGSGISLSIPELKGRRLEGREFDPNSDDELLSSRGEEFLNLLDSITREMMSRELQLNQHDTYLVWKLSTCLKDIPPGDPRAALFTATVLAHNRHWKLGCTEELTQVFRTHTLTYLGENQLSLSESEIFRRLIPDIELEDLGTMVRQDTAKILSHGKSMKLFGYRRPVSFALIYYAFESKLLGNSAHQIPAFNPEAAAMDAVLSLQENHLRNGSYPEQYPMDPDLGVYLKQGPHSAKIILRELDPTCRPSVVVRLGRGRF